MIKKKEDLVGELKEMRGGPGQVLVTNLATKEEMLDNGRLYASMVIEPGCGIGYHDHHDETEIFHVLEGSVIWNDGEKDTEVQAGGIMICEDGKGHSILNSSDKTAKLTALILLKR